MGKHLVIILSALELLFTPLLATECNSINGKWYNQLGSELILNETTHGFLQGELRTAVEKIPGSARHTYSDVRGVISKSDSGLLFGFSTIFTQGSAVASWLGQCLQCGGEELLQSTWLLQDKVEACSSHWQSTLINEDLFIRKDRISGPRKDHNTHVPQRTKNEASTQPYAAENAVHGNLNGKWYTADGIILNLAVNDTNATIKGTYNSKDSGEIEISGTFTPSNSAVFGLQAIVEKSKHAYVWVGQYDVCDNKREVLETSWLRRQNTQKCDRDFTATNFGRMTFYRTPPSETGSDGKSWHFSSVFSHMATKISDFFSNLFSR